MISLSSTNYYILTNKQRLHPKAQPFNLKYKPYTQTPLLSPCRQSSFQTEHFLGITVEDSFLIATIGLLPKLYLTGDSFIDLPFHIIKVLNNLAFIDEPAKPVGAMAVREMKLNVQIRFVK